MMLKFEKIGKYIEQSDLRNKDLKIMLELEAVKGISNNKVFIDTRANMKNVDLKNYKVVENQSFAFVTVTSRNGNKISIALNDKLEKLVSSTYVVFKIADQQKLLPEYLYLWFNRPEFDRYSRFHSIGSAREVFSWEDMCDVEILIPSIEEQRKIIILYNSLNVNLESSKSILKDLQLIAETYIDGVKKTKPFAKIGPYIKQSNFKNRDLEKSLEVDAVKGISNNKIFIETKANMKNVNINGYNVVEKLSFAFVTVTSRNGNKISIALNDSSKKLVSSTYVVFKVADSQKVLPEFLYLWFNRPEFDRYSRYHSIGSAREVFSWEDMCDVEIPLPSIAEQRAIVEIHHVLRNRKKIVDKLEERIKDLAPILIRGIVEQMDTVT